MAKAAGKLPLPPPSTSAPLLDSTGRRVRDARRASSCRRQCRRRRRARRRGPRAGQRWRRSLHCQSSCPASPRLVLNPGLVPTHPFRTRRTCRGGPTKLLDGPQPGLLKRSDPPPVPGFGRTPARCLPADEGREITAARRRFRGRAEIAFSSIFLHTSLLQKSDGSRYPPNRQSEALKMTEIWPPEGAIAHFRAVSMCRVSLDTAVDTFATG